jgi:DNA-binding LacI/PurR family transcriptional regulator
MRALKNLGLKCPRELSVLGFDEFDWYEFYNSLLTTILQPSYEMGTQATEMLVKVITAQHPPLESDGVNRGVLKAQLQQRESTAPPPTFASVAARSHHRSPAQGKITKV